MDGEAEGGAWEEANAEAMGGGDMKLIEIASSGMINGFL